MTQVGLLKPPVDEHIMIRSLERPHSACSSFHKCCLYWPSLQQTDGCFKSTDSGVSCWLLLHDLNPETSNPARPADNKQQVFYRVGPSLTAPAPHPNMPAKRRIHWIAAKLGMAMLRCRDQPDAGAGVFCFQLNIRAPDGSRGRL